MKRRKQIKDIIVFDIDMTLADMRNRIRGDVCIFDGMEDDEPIQEIAALVRFYKKRDFLIALCSCRREEHRAVTKNWLEEHNIPFDFLLLQKHPDHSRSLIEKKQMFEALGIDRIALVFDDREDIGELCKGLRINFLKVDYNE